VLDVMKPIQILKVKDKNEKHHIKKGLLFDIPFRLLVVGRSQLSGKSNFVANLLLQDDPRLYKNEFEGENIYIFSPSHKSDFKLKTLIEEKEIPKENVFAEFDENVIEALYEIVKDEYNEAIENKEKPTPKLFFFDDMSAGGDLKGKTNGIISKIFSNGRHQLCSICITAQKYTDLPTSARENASGAVLFSGTDRQLDLMCDDHNYLEKKTDFKKMYRNATNEPHSFFVINYSNPIETRYMDKNFEPINIKSME
tara:strand:+ start:2503 stop:3264 length:762 start_codon:yes stop_codon:yes gene_type:complete